MSLPDWVIPFKEPRTEIKCIKGKYYKYSVKHVYDPIKKRSVKKNICILGRITKDYGFVPSSKNTLKQEVKNPNVDTKTYGAFAIFEELLREEFNSLKLIFDKKLVEEIFSFSLMRWAYQSPIKRVQDYHAHHFSSEYWSKELALTDKVLTATLKNIGENREKVLSWMRGLLPDSAAERFILMDSTHAVTQSEYLEINAKGYNPSFDFDKQIRLLYMFSAELKQPVYYRLLNGNLSDLTTLPLCVKELGIQNIVFIADKGFYSQDNVNFLKNHKLQYVIPLHRSNSQIDYSKIINGSFKKDCGFFQYQKRIIWYYQYEDKGQKYVTFLDDKLRVEEEHDYLIRTETHPDEYSKEKYLEKIHTFGTLTITYSINEFSSAQQIYEIYKRRNEIEVMFDSYKNFLKADKMYMQNKYVLEGWLFCNFLAMIAYYKLFEKLRKAKLLAKYSPKDIIELSKSISQIKINGVWHKTEITKKLNGIFKKLDICALI